MNISDEIKKRTPLKNQPAETPGTATVAGKTVEVPQGNIATNINLAPQGSIAKDVELRQDVDVPTENNPKIQTYTDLINAFNKPKTLTLEEQEKERKREKAKAIISAVGDGVSAIANMYYTSKGAISTPTGPSLSEQNKKRYDAVIAKREAEQQTYINRLIDAGFKDQAAQLQKDLERSRQTYQTSENDKRYERDKAMRKDDQDYQSVENDKRFAAVAKQDELAREHQSKMAQQKYSNDLKLLNNRLEDKNYTPSEDDYRLAELAARYGLTPKNGENYTSGTEYREDGDGKTTTVKKNSPYSFFGTPKDVRNANLNNAKTIDYLISNGVPESKIKEMIPRIKAGEPIGRIIKGLDPSEKSAGFGYSPSWGVPSKKNEIPGF